MYTINKVIPGILIGNYDAASNIVLLQHHQITHILIVGEGLAQRFPNQYTYKQINIYDLASCNIHQYFEECSEFIQNCVKQKGKILIHCDTGISRAPTILIAYLMKTKNIGFTQALELLKKKHPEAQPNNGFVSQLVQYQNTLKTQSKKDGMRSDTCSCILI
ncbi:unnamed protein product [Blepharisma stoltei]|uniref:Dual specificity protein phosphatase n=1 Tax=Blepharisma stoltei TaxID=1481888 RepID=A0AAU9JPI7_9CILI|nr:unnamed protein product [Blepharisma stoltei]